MDQQQQSVENVYLQQVLEDQKEVDRALRKRSYAPAQMASAAPSPAPPPEDVDYEEEETLAGYSLPYRVTGFGPWRTVVVSPNVYVVHTRRGQVEPVSIGLGISFRFIPRTDAFLVIPSAMQTIIINANCICRERQGILVQAYVQWIIDDIKVAYRKLDFSDARDPMGIVNVQLREQAEAAIKDKVATMSIDEVLSDKQPIIEELTHRLRTVAEGSRKDEGGVSGGLGLKIVTVQIKEAIVSSTRLWQNLQIPFRAEREKFARLAEIASRQEIAGRELENRVTRETDELEAKGQLDTLRLESEEAIAARQLESRVTRETEELAAQSRLDELRADKARAKYDLEHAENVRRHRLEQEAERNAIAEHGTTEKARNESALELKLQALELEKRRIAAEQERLETQMQLEAVQAQASHARTEAELELVEMRHQADAAQTERELTFEKIRQNIANDLSDAHVQALLIERLPEIAEHLPAPDMQHTTLISSDGEDSAANALLRFLAGALRLIEDSRPAKDGDV